MASPLVKRAAIAAAIVVVLAGAGTVFWLARPKPEPPQVTPAPKEPVKPAATVADMKVIGKSVQGRNIEAYSYGNGPARLVFVGGVHGGYEWNSVLLAYGFLDYLDKNPDIVPKNVTVTIIPNANPDGVFRVVGKDGRFTAADVSASKQVQESGRFNANDVDLNRNFACRWQPQSTWRSRTVSAGTAPFSEPEAAAIRDYALANKPEGFIFWHSQANAVYASECKEGILPETVAIMNAYSKASGYPAVNSFSAYPVTGDSESWLASVGIPAVTVELSTHETIEWEKNLAGFKALLNLYASSPSS